MQLSLDTRPVLTLVATSLAQSAAGFRDGAQRLEAIDLTTPAFEATFNAGIRRMGDDWSPGMFATYQARDAVASLGDDPRAQAALQQLNGVIRHMNSGWDYIAQTLVNLPRPLEATFARLACDRIGAAGRSIAGVMDAASSAIAALAKAPLA